MERPAAESPHPGNEIRPESWEVDVRPFAKSLCRTTDCFLGLATGSLRSDGGSRSATLPRSVVPLSVTQPAALLRSRLATENFDSIFSANFFGKGSTSVTC